MFVAMAARGRDEGKKTGERGSKGRGWVEEEPDGRGGRYRRAR